MNEKAKALYEELIQRESNPFSTQERTSLLKKFVDSYEALDPMIEDLLTIVETVQRRAFEVGYIEGAKVFLKGGGTDA